MKPKLKAPAETIQAEIERLERTTNYLRGLSVEHRVGAIIAMHAWCVREFAVLVTEFTKPAPKPRKRKRR
jgi:hypothetical protein